MRFLTQADSVGNGPVFRQKRTIMQLKPAKIIVLAVALLTTSGCSALSGRCIYELRGVSTNGELVQAAGDTVSAEVILGEQRDTDPNKTMSWMIRGSSLKGRVQSITLRDDANPSLVLFTFPLTASSFPPLSNGTVSQNQGADLNGLFDVLAASRGIVVITTDIPGRGTVQLRLTVTSKSDWNRPYCS